MQLMRCWFADAFLVEDRTPASTIFTVWVELDFVLHVVALLVLTRFRRKRLLGET